MTLTLVTDCRRACPDARTDRALVTEALGWLSHAIDAGVDAIQIREHNLAAATLRDLTHEVVAAVHGTATRVIVNDRADVALVAGAHGVHLRDDGWPADRVRQLAAHGASRPAFAGRWIVGRSVHAGGPWPGATSLDYVIFGAVFGSAGKPARGVDALRAVVDSSPVPVLAIGGVTVETAPACLEAGASGVAAVGLFLPAGQAPGALGPRVAVTRLRAACRLRYTVTERLP